MGSFKLSKLPTTKQNGPGLVLFAVLQNFLRKMDRFYKKLHAYCKYCTYLNASLFVIIYTQGPITFIVISKYLEVEVRALSAD
jgi:hypothetical protein